MALGSTIHHFEIQLSDADRGVYEALSIKVARHPSETAESLATRVLAYCLEYTEGLAFSRGLAEPESPALAVRDLTGVLTSWIDVGLPDAARLHKASKAAPRVAVYTHRSAAQLRHALAGQKIHRAGALELYAFSEGIVPRSHPGCSGARPSTSRSPAATCTCRSATRRSRRRSSAWRWKPRRTVPRAMARERLRSGP